MRVCVRASAQTDTKSRIRIVEPPFLQTYQLQIYVKYILQRILSKSKVNFGTPTAYEMCVSSLHQEYIQSNVTEHFENIWFQLRTLEK